MNWSVGAAALAVLAGPAAAQPSSEGEFCQVLARIRTAAAEAEPFLSLRGAAMGSGGGQYLSRLGVPGFGGACYLARLGVEGRGRPSLWCHRSLAPPELSARRLTEATANCLSAAPRPAAGGSIFEASPVRISVEEHGTERSHVGRVVSYTVQVRDGAP